MSRVFNEILRKVGTKGKYQFTAQIFHCIYFFVAGACNFFYSFLFYQSPYICPSIYHRINCKNYVCGLSQHQQHKFLDKSFSSFTSRFGDHRCNDSIFDQLQMFIFIGGVCGVFIGRFLSQRISKRSILILCCFVNLIGLSLSFLDYSLQVASIGLFINFAAKQVQVQIIMCYVTQTVDEQIRSKYIIMLFIIFGISATLNGLVFKYIDWRVTLVVYCMVPISITLLGYIFYIKQTPLDMILYLNPYQSLLQLRQIAKENDIDFTMDVREIMAIKYEYESNMNAKTHRKISISDLFIYPSLRTSTIVCILLGFIITFQFDAPQLALQNYALQVYLNGVMIGFSEVIASIYSYFAIQSQPRKKVIAVTQIIGFLVSLSTIFLATCTVSCTFRQKLIQTVGLFIFRLSATISFNFFIMMQDQIFPHQVRAIALLTTALAACLSTVSVPAIMDWCMDTGIPIIAFFSLSCIFVIVLNLQLEQTLGTQPPEMIKQLEYQAVTMDHRLI